MYSKGNDKHMASNRECRESRAPHQLAWHIQLRTILHTAEGWFSCCCICLFVCMCLTEITNVGCSVSLIQHVVLLSMSPTDTVLH